MSKKWKLIYALSKERKTKSKKKRRRRRRKRTQNREEDPSTSSVLPLTGPYTPSDSQWFSGKEFTCQCRRHRRLKFDPCVGKLPWRRAWQPTPVFLPGASRGQRSLVGCSLLGRTESVAPERLRMSTDLWCDSICPNCSLFVPKTGHLRLQLIPSSKNLSFQNRSFTFLMLCCDFQGRLKQMHFKYRFWKKCELDRQPKECKKILVMRFFSVGAYPKRVAMNSCVQVFCVNVNFHFSGINAQE